MGVKTLKKLLNMKRISLIIFSLFISIHIYSQKISLGPELGVNVIPLESTNYGYNFQLGFHIGGHLKYKISEKFNISTGIFMTQKKMKYDMADTSSVFEYYSSLFQLAGIDEEEIDSIAQSFGANTDVYEITEGTTSQLFFTIPLLANFKFRNFNTYAGPYVGMLFSATKRQEKKTQIPLLNVIDISQFDTTGFASSFLPEAEEVSTSSRADKNNLRVMDLGFNIGIGYEINNLHFNLMYSQSFFDYRDNRNGDDFSPLKTLRFSMVYLFSLKQKSDSTPLIE